MTDSQQSPLHAENSTAGISREELMINIQLFNQAVGAVPGLQVSNTTHLDTHNLAALRTGLQQFGSDLADLAGPEPAYASLSAGERLGHLGRLYQSRYKLFDHTRNNMSVKNIHDSPDNLFETWRHLHTCEEWSLALNYHFSRRLKREPQPWLNRLRSCDDAEGCVPPAALFLIHGLELFLGPVFSVRGRDNKEKMFRALVETIETRSGSHVHNIATSIASFYSPHAYSGLIAYRTTFSDMASVELLNKIVERHGNHWLVEHAAELLGPYQPQERSYNEGYQENLSLEFLSQTPVI